ncbi:hypothetical protein DB346_09280 [Verrucomicrobia bacterium LW23]|nr:hypothetical protein DB346_09280 [Verrucomicrobia bacterium LW23]
MKLGRRYADLAESLPDTRRSIVARGRYLIGAGLHDDEQTLRRLATLLSSILGGDANASHCEQQEDNFSGVECAK